MKVTATIQARMASSRLPGKILKPIAGKPMLQRHVERVQRARLVDEVIIATSVNVLDDQVEALGKAIGVKVYRGPEDDVLGRIAGLLRAHQVELHVELFGDSPLTDPQLLDEFIGYYLKYQRELDYVSNGIEVTYPPGMESNLYPARVLLEAESRVAAKDPLREHVSIHITRDPKFRCRNLEAPAHYRFPETYLEVDTETDFEVMTSIFEHFQGRGMEHFTLAQVLDLLRENPKLADRNRGEERRWKAFKGAGARPE